MIEIQPESYLEHFKKGGLVSILCKSFVLEDLIPVYNIIETLLCSKKLDKFVAYSKTVVKELTQNALKATQKRYFFHIKSLNIQTDYEKGMQGFKEFLQENKYMPLPDIFDFAARIQVFIQSDRFLICVANQGELVEFERKAIENMIERGKKINSVAELLENEVKHKEGGGLGLSMIVVLGKSLNLSFPLHYKSENGFTEFCLHLPLES